jgi:hypothetical protein
MAGAVGRRDAVRRGAVAGVHARHRGGTRCHSPPGRPRSSCCWRRPSSACAWAPATKATVRPEVPRGAYDALAAGFGAGFNAPLSVMITLPRSLWLQEHAGSDDVLFQASVIAWIGRCRRRRQSDSDVAKDPINLCHLHFWTASGHAGPIPAHGRPAACRTTSPQAFPRACREYEVRRRSGGRSVPRR